MYIHSLSYKTFLLLFMSMIVPGCVKRTSNYTIEVKGGSSIEEKINIAKGVVTEERLAKLKEELKRKQSELTDADLSRMGLRWNENWTFTADGEKANRFVTIIVSLEQRGSVDTAAVILAAARALDAQINGADSAIPSELSPIQQ